jgi:hypothetical protein
MIIPKYDEPRVAGIVRFDRSMYAGGGGTCGRSEGVRDIVINIDESVRVGSDKGCIYGRVGRRDVAKEETGVPMEETSTCESLCEVVRDVEFCVNALEQH